MCSHQEVIVPFLVPIVYPTKRNERDIEEAIHVGNILWP